MHRISVVPKDAEVGRGGLEGSDAAHNLVGIGDTRGIGILGYAPHALDRGIAAHQSLDLIHVRAVVANGYGHVADAITLGDCEVAVIARARAEELHLALNAPRRVSADALGIGVHHHVMHEVEARRACHDHVLRVHAQKLCRETSGGGKAIGEAVVIGGGSLIHEFRLAGQKVQHRTREVGLLGTRLASRHVELETERANLCDLLLELRYGRIKLCGRHLLVCVWHDCLLESPSCKV